MLTRRVAAAAMVFVLTAGCGGGSTSDDGAEPTDAPAPTPSATATTPLPKGLRTPPAEPTLTSDEKAAADDAIRAFDAGNVALFKLESDPDSALRDRAATQKILEAYYDPTYAKNFVRTIEAFASRGQRIDGTVTTRWVVPVEVDLEAATPTVVLEHCSTFEQLRILGKGADKIQVADSAISRTTLTATGGAAAFRSWTTKKADALGTC